MTAILAFVDYMVIVKRIDVCRRQYKSARLTTSGKELAGVSHELLRDNIKRKDGDGGRHGQRAKDAEGAEQPRQIGNTGGVGS